MAHQFRRDYLKTDEEFAYQETGNSTVVRFGVYRTLPGM
jgi:hypothetical protein